MAPERRQPVVSLASVGEVDGYNKSVAGVEIDAIRTGEGVRPNSVLTVEQDRLTFTSCDVGFPMMSCTTIGDDRIAIAHIIEAPTKSRWCEIDLAADTVLVYGPGAEHAAVNHPGLRFSFAVAGYSELAELAEQFELNIGALRGKVFELAPSYATSAVGVSLRAVGGAAVLDVRQLDRQCDEVRAAMAVALAEPVGVRQACKRRGADSRHVVQLGLDYAVATGRIPSISELCLAAHVSERRLRTAFVEEFDVPPSKFFRAWALGEARRRLLASAPGERTVAEIASDLGFYHLGRFAGYFKNTFGQSPSNTLGSRGPN